MTVLNFTKEILKPIAFSFYLNENFIYHVDVSIDGTAVTLTTAETLTGGEEADLTTLVNNYVDPEFFLQLNRTACEVGVSEKTNSSELQDVQSFIFPSTTNIHDDTVLDSVKTVIKLQNFDVQGTSGMTTGSVTVEIHDQTRDLFIATETLNVDDVVTDWAAKGATGMTGEVNGYKTLQFTGLKDKNTDFDCIWVFRMSTTDERIYARMNGLQKLFYDVL